MLQKRSVDPKLFKLLEGLMKMAGFEDLFLVGGTALALQLGHRISVDIDLFGKITLSEFEISELMRAHGNIQLLNKSKNITIYSIDGVKVDIVNYPYKWIDEPVYDGGLRLAGKKDIAAMKLNAIAGRGSKKDFIDLFFLLKEFSLADMLGYYKQKYPEGSEFLVLKSLSWFEDADTEPDVMMLTGVRWMEIKQVIIKTTSEYLK